MRQWMRRWIRVGTVSQKLAQSESQTWEDNKEDPDFPDPIRPGPRMTVWDELEIDAYMIRKMAARDNVKAEDLEAYVEKHLARQWRIAALAEAS